MNTPRVAHSNPQRHAQSAFRRTTVMAALLCVLSGLLCANTADGQHALAAAAAAPVVEPPSTKASAEIQRATNCRIIYLGFVGALEPAHNKYSGVVQIGDLLQGNEYPDVCAKTYSPYVWDEGLHWLLTHFPSHAGVLSAAELLRAPKVILVGHSMGGWAIVNVARRLSSRDIPVELTIQVDSVGITDYTLPRNINYAAIFHARDVLMPLTTKKLRMEDPSHTKLLENVTVKGAGHESITRDPRIRELVIQTIADLRASFSINPVTAASTPTAPAQE
jgi:hypothetical protein